MQMKSPRNDLIELENVWMQWDRHIVLEDVSLNIAKGDFIVITGPNGGGKTTLLRIMLRLLKPTRGRVLYKRQSSDEKISLSNKPRAFRIGYLPQKEMLDNLFPISVKEVVASGILSMKMPKQERQERVEETLKRIGLEKYSSSAIGSLSGGQLQRALLGRAIICDPQILVLDEPSSYIDKIFESQMYRIISQMAESATILLVSHDLSAVSTMANRIIRVNRTLKEE